MTNIFSRFKSTVGIGAGGQPGEGLEITPEYSLEQLVKAREELDDSLAEIEATQTRLAKKRDELAENVEQYAAQARTAVESEREADAKASLRKKQKAEAQLAELKAEIAELKQRADELREIQPEVEREISLLESSEESSQAQQRVHDALAEMPEELASVGHVIYQAQARVQASKPGEDEPEDLAAEGALLGVKESEQAAGDRESKDDAAGTSVEEELAQLKAEVGQD